MGSLQLRIKINGERKLENFAATELKKFGDKYRVTKAHLNTPAGGHCNGCKELTDRGQLIAREYSREG